MIAIQRIVEEQYDLLKDSIDVRQTTVIIDALENVFKAVNNFSVHNSTATFLAMLLHIAFAATSISPTPDQRQALILHIHDLAPYEEYDDDLETELVIAILDLGDIMRAEKVLQDIE